jgi:metal-responsive CopG/Arc/MetJ family transcriptional regulator
MSKKQKQKQQLISFSLTDELFQELENYCKELDRTRSYITRYALKQFLQSVKNKKNNQENKN